MTDVNEKQVGGRHYKSGYQHWDFVITHELHYLLACATKYVTRRKGDRFEDLQKAIHYIEKMIDASKSGSVEIGCKFFAERQEDIELFCRENELTFREYEVIREIVVATDAEGLETAIEIIREIMKKLPGGF